MKSGECRVCGHNVILHIAEVADVIGDWNDGEAPAGETPAAQQFLPSLPFRIARLPGQQGRPRSDVSGLVEAFVCKSCGYTELYTRAPGAIPVDGQYVREIKGPTRVGPYR
jgi:hypothetical protein